MKIEETVEALCHERVTASFLAKIRGQLSEDINSIVDKKLTEMLSDIKSSLMQTLAKEIKEAVKEAITPIYQEINTLSQRLDKIEATTSPIPQEINALGQRLEQIEAQSVLNEIYVLGLKDHPTITKEGLSMQGSRPATTEPVIDLIINYLKQEMNIHLTHSDINYAYRTKKISDPNLPTPILVNFVSAQKRNELLLKIKTQRKLSNKSAGSNAPVYFNERLTKLNSEIAYKARLLQRNKKITSTWIFRGESYLRKEHSSKPVRILKLSDLAPYE